MIRERLATVGAVLIAIAFIAYPFAVYAGLRQWSVRFAALALLVVFLPFAIVRLVKMKRTDLTTVAMIPLVTVVLLVSGALFDEVGLMLAEPIAVHTILLITFATTMFRPPPMIERFARLQHKDLTDAELAWCRMWTQLWCAFFAVNAVVAAALIPAPMEVWALWNGLVVYALMGLMVGVEFIMRKLRFRRFGTGPVDRLLMRLSRDENTHT